MHMPDRDCEGNEFVEEPCDIEYSFVLGHRHKVVLF